MDISSISGSMGSTGLGYSLSSSSSSGTSGSTESSSSTSPSAVLDLGSSFSNSDTYNALGVMGDKSVFNSQVVTKTLDLLNGSSGGSNNGVTQTYNFAKDVFGAYASLGSGSSKISTYA